MGTQSLPDGLYDEALKRFDKLLSQGRLLYTETKCESLQDKGFNFEFRISPALLQKPVLPADARERQGQGGPFLNPDPDFVIHPAVGPNHVLELNMFCIYRPSFVLHTKEFALQTDPLDFQDLSAATAVMQFLSQGSGKRQIMIYNCGVEAGSSQGHKHMQIFAMPTTFELFPARATSVTDINDSIPDVPQRHFVLRLPEPASVEDRLRSLERLVKAARSANATEGLSGHAAFNVLMTDDWVCVIPRRHARKGNAGANAMGMVGDVWVKDAAERESWTSYGFTDHLAYLGIPSKRE